MSLCQTPLVWEKRQNATSLTRCSTLSGIFADIRAPASFGTASRRRERRSNSCLPGTRISIGPNHGVPRSAEARARADCRAPYHSISQQSGRTNSEFKKHCSDKSSLRYSAIRGRDPPRAHAQARRVPAIASPRILRPIYTHTPATGFPYPRDLPAPPYPGLEAVRGSRSRPVLAPALARPPPSNGASALPPCRRRVSAMRIGASSNPLERTSRACFSLGYRPLRTTSPSNELGTASGAGQSDRVSRSTSRARAPSRNSTRVRYYSPAGRTRKEGPVFRASRIDPPAYFRSEGLKAV